MPYCMKCGQPCQEGASICAICAASQSIPVATQTAPPPPPPAYAPLPQSYGVSSGSSHQGKAIASLVLGIIGLFAWFIPLFGFPITLTGLILGIFGLKSSNRTMAVWGVILSSIGLVATLINSAWGAYLGATGQLF